jgi:integrase
MDLEFVQPIRDKKQIEAIKKILMGSNLRDYTLFVLGINSGLRISDLLRLSVGDCLDERGRLRDRITLRENKTGKTKDFPLGKNATKALNDYLHITSLPTSSPLFPSRKGKNIAIGRVQAYKILNDAASAVGIRERIGTHTLRKTFAYHAYKAGYDLSMIQKLLNHSAPSVTLRYIGITRDEMDSVYLSLNL